MVNLYAIPPLLCSIFILIVGVLVLSRNFSAATNRTFFLICLSTMMWLSFYAINYNSSSLNKNSIEAVYRIAYCGVAFIGIFYFHYLTTFLELKWTRGWNLVNYFFGTVVSILILKTNFVVAGLYKFFWGYYPKAGIWHPYFLVYYIFIILSSIFFLLQARAAVSNDKRRLNQIKYQLFAFSIFGIACLDFVPNYGIELYPFGYLPAAIFVGIISYTIIKYQLMDIIIVIRRGLIYSLLISIISVTYLATILLFEHYFQSIIGYSTFVGSFIAAALIAIVVTPLKIKIQFLIDKIIFKGSPIEISEENEQLRKEVAQTERFKAAATLANSVAHEIKNPLAAIQTFLEYFPNKKNDPEFLEKFNKIVPQEIKRINDLAQQLLEFAKPSPLELKDVNIHELLNDSLDLLSTQFKQHNVAVVKKFFSDDFSPVTKADANKLKQVFINL